MGHKDSGSSRWREEHAGLSPVPPTIITNKRVTLIRVTRFVISACLIWLPALSPCAYSLGVSVAVLVVVIVETSMNGIAPPTTVGRIPFHLVNAR
jgi:hypothetical protein